MTFEEIEDCFPEDGFFANKDGSAIEVSAQELHDFARRIEAAVLANMTKHTGGMRMSNKKYPAIGRKTLPRSRSMSGLPCIICGTLTTGKVDIEVSIFRGEDDQVRVCEKHQTKHDQEIIEAYKQL